MFLKIKNLHFKQIPFILNYFKPHMKLLSTQVNDGNLEKWTELYRLPVIPWIVALNKVKMYQIGITTIGIPIAFTLESLGHIPENFSLVFTSLGVTGGITLLIASLATKNMVGFIYVNDTKDKIKLSYIDFWGKRKNLEGNIDDVILSKQNQATLTLDLFQPVKFVGKENETYKIIHRLGKVSNGELYSYIFGE